MPFCKLPRAQTDLNVQRVSISWKNSFDPQKVNLGDLIPEYGRDHVLQVHWIQ